jgi:tripartite-type tricarboxylate transporter receptor subunit TctC
MLKRCFLALAASVTLMGSAAFAQQDYPSRPIRLLVPFAPGGGTDAAARVISKKLSENLGQSIVVDNKGGAGGNIAAAEVAKAEPDGYTLFFGAIGPLSINPSLYRKLQFDPLKDFAPITMAVVFSNVLVAHPSVAANNVQELIAAAKSSPGTLNYGSSGTGGVGHLAGELFNNMAEVDLVHVPYKGGGPAMIDLIGGQIQLVFATAPTAIEHVRAGQIKALGVTSSKRMEALPDVPTIAEAGLSGYEVTNWYCFVAPAATPEEIIAKLNDEIRKAMASPEVNDALLAQGMEPTPTSPGELGTFIRSETEKWAQIIKERNITSD